MNLLVAQTVSQHASNNWQWIGNLISGVFVIIAAVIAYLSTSRTLKVQREIAEKQMISAKEVNQSQMNEKILLETRVAWDNETRELIAKLIGQLFSLNHVIEKANLIRKRIDLSSDSSISPKQREKMMRITDSERNDLKSEMETHSSTVETIALVRLHLFEDTPNERILWDKIRAVEQHMSKFEKIPSNELEQLTELARTYFLGNWGRLMMMNDTDNDIVNTASHRGDEM